MTKLTLNGHAAIIKAGFSFKLTQTNPYLTDAGSYTLDVTLPLKGCAQNQHIFGALHRKETSLASLVGTSFTMHLLAPPIELDGYATVTSINELEVKVQLIAESSNLSVEREIPNGQNIYIDKLDLGRMNESNSPDEYDVFDKISNGKHIYSTYPIYSETDEITANETYVYWLTQDMHYGLKDTGNFTDYTPITAKQPYLVYVLEKVLQVLGYNVRSNAIRNNWMQYIFIANAHADTVLAHLLPHWTVDEFLEEVRNFFGVYILLEGTEVDIVTKNDLYSGDRADVVRINEPLDERETDINKDDELKDISAANVAYDYEYDGMLCLPDEVWENAIIKTFPNERELAQWSGSVQVDKTKSEYLMVNSEDGSCYAWLKETGSVAFSFARVNCMPPLIRKNPYDANTRRDIDIKLRIVPIRMTPQAIMFRHKYLDNNNVTRIHESELWIPMMTTRQETKDIYQDFSVNVAVNPDSEDTEHEVTEKSDVIEVAYNPRTTWKAQFKDWDGSTLEHEIRTPFGVSVWKMEDGHYWNLIMPGNNEQFRLTQNLPPSIRKTAMETDYSIDTRCQHMIPFLDDGKFPVKSVYHINGKRYVCLKIEYTVNERGCAPLKRGYFYELN